MIQGSNCGFYIKQLHDALERNANNSLRNQDLTLAQMGALQYLGRLPEKEAPLKDLEKAMKIAQSTAAGIISRLEQKGFVEGFGSSEDKRIKMVRITPLGEKQFNESTKYMEAAENILMKNFTENEKSLFLQLLKKSSDNIK